MFSQKTFNHRRLIKEGPEMVPNDILIVSSDSVHLMTGLITLNRFTGEEQ